MESQSPLSSSIVSSPPPTAAALSLSTSKSKSKQQQQQQQLLPSSSSPPCISLVTDTTTTATTTTTSSSHDDNNNNNNKPNTKKKTKYQSIIKTTTPTRTTFPSTTNDDNNNTNNNNNNTTITNNEGRHHQGYSHKRCTMCATCPCSQRGAALKSLENQAIQEQLLHQSTSSSLSSINYKQQQQKENGMNARMERALIGRLKRLEKSAAWFDHLAWKVHRQLKKHRNWILKLEEEKKKEEEKRKRTRKKRKTGSGGGSGDGGDHEWRYLQDVKNVDNDDDDNDDDDFVKPLSKKLVQKATNKTFAFRKKNQPTLTQMLDEGGGGETSEDHHYKSNNDNQDMTSQQQQQLLDDEQSIGLHELNEHILDNSRNDDDEDDETYNMSCLNKNDKEEEEEDDDDVMMDFQKASQRGKHNSLWNISQMREVPKSNPDDNNIIKILDCEFDECTNDAPNTTATTTTTTTTITRPMKSDGSICCDNRTSNNDIIDDTISLMEEDGAGIDDLVNMFLLEEEADNNKQQQSKMDDDSVANRVDMDDELLSKSRSLLTVDESLLTPRRKSIYNTIEESVVIDDQKHNAVETACPNWRENIQFGLLQTDLSMTREALENVQNRRQKLADVKSKILSAFYNEDLVLDLYSRALTSSLMREKQTNRKLGVEEKKNQ